MNWEKEKTNFLNNAISTNGMPDGFDESAPNRIVTPSSLMIIDNDLVITYTNPDMEFSDESADQNVSAIWDIVKNRSIFHLIVPDSSTHVTVEARDYKNERFESIKKAEAIVIKTLGHRLLAQFYLKARKDTHYPVRIFESENDAREWFETLREDPLITSVS